MKKSGFTLVEMLVVIGIIAVLSAASMVGYSRIIKASRKSKNIELVSNVATALTHMLSKEGEWPRELIDGIKGKSGVLDKDVAKVFIRHKLLGLSHNLKSGSEGNYDLIGKDRCGIVDSEAETVLKNPRAGEGTRVPSGGTVRDHILYYAIDDDGDGIVESDFGRIRASAIVWSAGPDGKVEYEFRGRNDDVYSWRPGQAID